MSPATPTRARIVSEARAWIGTPYHHQASLCGTGTDCLGLVRGLYRALYGHEPEPAPAYSPDWAEADGADPLLDAARRHLIEIPATSARHGDVLLFRWRRGRAAKHLASISAPDRMIHAIEGAPVCEVALSPWWRRHVAAAFAFPGVQD